LGGGEANVATQGADGTDGSSTGWVKVEDPNTGQVTAHYESYNDGNLTVGTLVGHYDPDSGELVPDSTKTFSYGTGTSYEQTFNRDVDGNVTSIQENQSVNGIPLRPADPNMPGYGNPDRPLIVPVDQQPPAQPYRDTPSSLPQPEQTAPDNQGPETSLTTKLDGSNGTDTPLPPSEKVPDDRMERYGTTPWDWQPPTTPPNSASPAPRPSSGSQTASGYGVWAEGAAQTISGQGVQAGFVRDFYTSAVESLDSTDTLSRTLIKLTAQGINSPIGNAIIYADRGVDLGGPSTPYWQQIVGISEGSANITNTVANNLADNARIIGAVGLIVTTGIDAYQTYYSDNPLETGLERGFGLVGSLAGGYAGGTAGLLFGGALAGPPGAVAGSIAGSVAGGALGGQLGRELGGYIYQNLARP